MWNLKEFESIYSRYESSGLKVHDFCTNEVIMKQNKVACSFLNRYLFIKSTM